MLLARHESSSEVAFGADAAPRTAADLLRDAATIKTALEHRPGFEPGQVLMLFQTDRYAFAATLLGAWAAGCAVTLPPNQRGETIAELLRERQVLALAHDTAVEGHLHIPTLLAQPGNASLDAVQVPTGAAAYCLTSGTSGAPEAWPKQAKQLLAEVEVLHRTFELTPGQRFVPTIAPAHLYGLLFGVLLPLTCGGSFLRETPLQPQAVSERVQRYQAPVLVTVPFHLRAAQTVEPGELAALRTVFSSTSPLPGSVATQFARTHRLPITEIFGSTETGGIAWRRRDQGDAWRPLPGVALSTSGDGLLTVNSDFIGPSVDKPYVTADRVQLNADQSFSHLGRSDGIVKVGGRRVSLPALEEWLQQLDGVDDCAVIGVEQAARGVRIIAALVAPSWTQQQQDSLRSEMAKHFDAASLPRRFSFVHRLPREENGKLSRQRVLEALSLNAEGTPLSREIPFELSEGQGLRGPGQVRAVVRLPLDHLAFGGHFKHYPVLPGAVQVQQLVVPVAHKARPELSAVQTLSRTKFTERIAPGDELQVTLQFKSDAPECDFTISKQGSTHEPIRCAYGRVNFFREPPTKAPAADLAAASPSTEGST